MQAVDGLRRRRRTGRARCGRNLVAGVIHPGVEAAARHLHVRPGHAGLGLDTDAGRAARLVAELRIGGGAGDVLRDRGAGASAAAARLPEAAAPRGARRSARARRPAGAFRAGRARRSARAGRPAGARDTARAGRPAGARDTARAGRPAGARDTARGDDTARAGHAARGWRVAGPGDAARAGVPPVPVAPPVLGEPPLPLGEPPVPDETVSPLWQPIIVPTAPTATRATTENEVRRMTCGCPEHPPNSSRDSATLPSLVVHQAEGGQTGRHPVWRSTTSTVTKPSANNASRKALHRIFRLSTRISRRVVRHVAQRPAKQRQKKPDRAEGRQPGAPRMRRKRRARLGRHRRHHPRLQRNLPQDLDDVRERRRRQNERSAERLVHDRWFNSRAVPASAAAGERPPTAAVGKLAEKPRAEIARSSARCATAPSAAGAGPLTASEAPAESPADRRARRRCRGSSCSRMDESPPVVPPVCEEPPSPVERRLHR